MKLLKAGKIAVKTSAEERGKLAASLKEAEARIKAGEGIDFDAKTFANRLMEIYRGDKR